jgi:hypothetical protein
LKAAIGPQPYTIEIVSADIAPAKPNGTAWDGLGDGPDVFVDVSVRGAGTGNVRSTVIKNSTHPEWKEKGRVTINVGDSLAVIVTDKDAVNDDRFATFDERFDRPRRYTFSDPASSVERLVLVVTPAPLTPEK